MGRDEVVVSSSEADYNIDCYDRTKDEAGTGNNIEAVRHVRSVMGDICVLRNMDDAEVFTFAKKIAAPYDLVMQTKQLGRLPDQELCALLVLSNPAKRHCAGTEAVGLLHSAGGRRRLPGGLGGELLPRSLASGGLTCCLLGMSH
ncbi:unnamed protein product [Camellia sinensis]